jgi:hypothetical protein
VGDTIREETKSCLKSRRDYATAARTIASNATTEEAWAVFLRIAAQWEKEIDTIQNGALAEHPVAAIPNAPTKPFRLLSYMLSLARVAP